VGRDSVVGVATRCELDGAGIESRWGKIFSTRRDRPWGPPNLLYNGHRVIPGGKRSRRGVDHPPPSSDEVKESVELYLYSTSGPSWPVLGCNLPDLCLAARSELRFEYRPANLKNRVGSPQMEL
jgi:hypothetical protein